MSTTTKRPASNASSTQQPPKKKAKFVNDTYLTDDEFGQGRWMVTVFRQFPNEFHATPQDIIERAVLLGFVVEGKWQDRHQGIRSYISLWNKKYREMHQHVRKDLPCTNGCERTGVHRICSKGRKPVLYWMREQHYLEVYRGHPAQVYPHPVQRSRPPPRMPRVPFIDFSVNPQPFPLQRKPRPTSLPAEPIVDKSLFTEVTNKDFSSLFEEQQDEIIPDPPRLEEDFVDISTKDIVAATVLMGLSRESTAAPVQDVTSQDIAAAHVLMDLSHSVAHEPDVRDEDISLEELDRLLS